MTEPAGRPGAAGPDGAEPPGRARPRFYGCAAVREYIAQRRQIDQLQAKRAQITSQLRSLENERKKLSDPSYIERLARDGLHMSFPHQNVYVIIDPANPAAQGGATRPDVTPWYARLWSSVQQASAAQAGPARPPARTRRR